MKAGGKYVFGISVFLVLVVGILTAAIDLLKQVDAAIMAVLVLLGVVVGLLNVTRHEAREFLVASIVLILATFASRGTTFVTVPFIGIYFASILDTFVAFLVPAVVTVAIKTIFDLARD